MKRIISILFLVACFTIAKSQNSPFVSLSNLDSMFIKGKRFPSDSASQAKILNNTYNDTLIKFVDTALQINANGNFVINRGLDTATTTRTLTAHELATHPHIAATQGSGITLKLPTASALGAEIGAVQGTEFTFVLDNSGGTGTDSISVNTGIAAAKQTSNGDTAVGILQTVAASSTIGVGEFKLVFIASGTAVLFRIF